ncbi:hypothetical protein JW756_05280 [Candidatus Woesearchaeota archaeon]|nr:hypothetical protein [Candidatus Woesearchaeota archaeon]
MNNKVNYEPKVKYGSIAELIRDEIRNAHDIAPISIEQLARRANEYDPDGSKAKAIAEQYLPKDDKH